jgi:Protein of unknown function (DUF2726)
MSWSLLILIIVLLVVAGLLQKFLPIQKPKTGAHYQQRDALFTEAEQKFLSALDLAVQGRCRVFGQVRAADVLEPKARRNAPGWQSAFNRVQSKHFDFVLCDPGGLKIVAVIELDDSSHSQSRRQKRDRFLDEACASAGLPLIHFPVKSKYDPVAIQAQLVEVLGAGEASQVGDVKKPCPNCGHGLDRIEAREGALAGKPIWRCSRYPECRTLIPALP